MEVRLHPELESKLSRLAEQQGRATESLIEEAVKRLVDHDEWFRREVQKGLAAAERGEFVEHDEIRRMIDRRQISG
jgi:predicted transcriptional regulator